MPAPARRSSTVNLGSRWPGMPGNVTKAGPTIRLPSRWTRSGSRCAGMWHGAGSASSRTREPARRSWRAKPMAVASSRWRSVRPMSTSNWQADTGRDAILDGDGRTFAQVQAERLRDDAETPPMPLGPLREPEPHASSASPSTPAHAVSTSGSPLPSPDIVLCAMSNGEAYAAAILLARMEEAALDHAPVWDDVASFDYRPWRSAVDINTAGYPCQPLAWRPSAGARRPTPPLAACRPRHRRCRAALRWACRSMPA